MPTPMPTIAAVAVAQSGTSTTRRSSSPSARDMPRPNTAVSSGRPIATAEPNVNSRISAAAIRPMPSPPAGVVWDSAATGPLASTRRVSSPAARTGSMSALARAGVYSSAVWSSATAAYAVLPSCETWLAPLTSKGPATPTTCGSVARSARTCSARVRTPAEEKPSSEWKTTWTVSPARCGNVASSVCAAACDSDPGWK